MLVPTVTAAVQPLSSNTTTLHNEIASLNNSGTLEAVVGGSITTTGDFTNSGQLVVSNTAGDAATISAANLNNTVAGGVGGSISASGDLTLNLTGTQLNNAGVI